MKNRDSGVHPPHMIEWFPVDARKEDKFSIVIPSWNNIEFLKLCIASIEKNSKFKHQVIVHINEGSDGTLEWVRDRGLGYSYSRINVGVCSAVNACRVLVKTDYIVFLNDDMYLLPNWDVELWREIESIGHKYFFLSSSIIEPRKSPHPSILAPYDFGASVENFRETDLLNEYQSINGADWSGATWPPNIVHRDIWDLVGGYSIEYFPGLYSDPDFSMKLFESGVRHFKGLDSSRAYHFGSKSTMRVKMNHGSKQFLNKWGLTSSTVSKFFLRRGFKYSGPIKVDYANPGLKWAVVKSFLKRIWWSFSGNVRTHGPYSK